MKFVTMSGRAKHLRTSAICKRWWVEYLETTRCTLPSSDESSSEVGSDEEYVCPTKGCDGDVLMELDQELVDSKSCYGNYGAEPEDAEFTSSPSGIELHSDSAVLADATEPLISVEEYPGAAQVVGESENLFTRIWESDKLYESRKIGGSFYPFSGSIEWEVAEWLHSLDVPMERIDRFFELEYVRI